MAEATNPPRAKLICGMISADAALFDRAAAAMAEAFGPVDVVSGAAAFDFTDYYDEQMGSPLQRKFAAFQTPVCPDFLVEAKRTTNALERDFAASGAGAPARPINLDVGYVTLAKLVLASMKNFSHRIYLGGGVYGELTMMYRQGRWQPLPWTFPDYASRRYDAFLCEARDRLQGQIGQETRS